MRILLLYLMAIAVGLFPRLAVSQVVINEFCFANYSDYALSGEYEDWVEFYNSGGAAFDISGYWLSDRLDNPQKWQIPAGTTVPPNGYRLILVSGTGDYNPTYLGQINTDFKITQTAGEELVFSNTSGTVLESYDFDVISPNQENHSMGRTPNGGANWAIQTNPSPNAVNSGTTGNSYVDRPVFSMESGYYGGAINVSLSSPDPSATIYYTLDGTDPDNTDAVYSGPISISTTKVLKAVAYSSDPQKLRSFVVTNTYFFGADTHSVYVVSVSGTTLDGGWNGDEKMHIEFFAPGGTFITEASGDSNEHGNDSNAYGQRGFDYITRDAMGYDNEIDHPLFHHSDRPGYERLIFKAAANDNYSFEQGAHLRDAYVHELSILGNLKLDERKTESCVVYLNGKYWGVYEFREKVDDYDFTDYYYDQPEGFVDFLKTWGNTWADYGSGADWNTLVNFINSNNMTVPANYDYVESQLNTHSLIDYFILNTYTVCTDWLNWNTAWWRGRHPDGEAKRWRYALWDMDATFGHYIDYTGLPSNSPTSSPCQVQNIGNVGGQGHVPILNKLFTNEEFMADYVQRYAIHSNGIFSCDRMIEVLDSMEAVIDPEMARQAQRWGGSYNGWKGSVQSLRNYILARCNDEIIGSVGDCYDVDDYTLTIVIEGEGSVSIEDEIDIASGDSPWTGIFFSDLPIDIEAFVEAAGGPCGAFSGWEITSGNGTIGNADSLATTLTIFSDVTLTVHLTPPSEVILTVDVDPVGAGAVSVNGSNQGALPASNTFAPGEVINLSATANEWFVFTGWQAGGQTTISPDASNPQITVQPCLTDTVIALFDEIPHFSLTAWVEPVGAGTIALDGTDLPSYPWTDILEGDIDYSFVTTPANEFCFFSHWEINHHVLSPDNLTPSVILHLMETDTLIAVYEVIETADITVRVLPQYTGTVSFGEGFSTQSETSVVLENTSSLDYSAAPEEYWNFAGWVSAHGQLIQPDALSELVTIGVSDGDTITALFTPEPFSYYVPNTFTPNDDGINDVFFPVTHAMVDGEYEFRVFNRWGEMVFETKDPEKPWDGSHLGGSYFAEDGAYVWTLRIQSVHERAPEEIMGTVILIR